MKQVKVLSHETFIVYWLGKVQPIGGCSKELAVKYIANYINSGLAQLNQFTVISNYGALTTETIRAMITSL